MFYDDEVRIMRVITSLGCAVEVSPQVYTQTL